MPNEAQRTCHHRERRARPRLSGSGCGVGKPMSPDTPRLSSSGLRRLPHQPTGASPFAHPFALFGFFFKKKTHMLYFSIYNLPHSMPLIDPGAHWATSRTPEEPPHYGKGWCESGPAPRDTLLLAPEAHLPWAAWLTCPSPQALRPAENPQPREAREGRLSVLSRMLIRESPPSP